MKNEDIGLSPYRWIAFLQKLYKNGGAYQNWYSYIHSNKDFLCEVQGKLASFSVIGAERHKTLRLSLQDYKNATPTDKQARHDDLLKAKEALDKFVEFNLAVASQTVYTALHKYFEPRKKASRHDPRFCIKLLKKRSSADFVYTFTRDEGSKSKLEVNFETACEKNTGFYYVSQSGKPFFCNDLTKEKTYKNPRLNAGRVAGYSSSIMFSVRRFFASDPLTDEDWVNCWSEEGSNIRPPASSCYKSTLIVPMTLLAKQVTPEFSSAYNSRWPPDQDKYNFGCLCIDCHEVDFFEDYDKVALFSYADMFSLFLIEAHSLTVHSSTYAEVEKSLSSSKTRSKKK